MVAGLLPFMPLRAALHINSPARIAHSAPRHNFTAWLDPLPALPSAEAGARDALWAMRPNTSSAAAEAQTARRLGLGPVDRVWRLLRGRALRVAPRLLLRAVRGGRRVERRGAARARLLEV